MTPGPLLDHHTVRVGRRTHGSLDISDDGLWRVLSWASLGDLRPLLRNDDRCHGQPFMH